MTMTKSASPLSLRAFVALFACVLGVLALQATSLRADGNARSLPVKAAFEKTTAENGPYLLHLTNTSSDELMVSAKVVLSLPSHADHKTREVPAHMVKAGDTWTIDGLAASDKVTVMAAGYAPLELTVP